MTRRLPLLLLLLFLTAWLAASAVPAQATPLAANKTVSLTDGNTVLMKVAASTHVYKGAMLCAKTDGYVVAATDASAYKFVGVAVNEVNNTGADGAASVTVQTEGELTAVYASAAATQVGEICYIVDDQTVAAVGTTTNDVTAGLVVRYTATNTVRVRYDCTAFDADLTAHLNDTVAAHAGTAVSNTPAGTIAATTAQAAIDEASGDTTNHLADTTAAHAASAIAVTPVGSVAATDAQAAVAEIDGDVTTHVGDASAAHAASAIGVTPVGSVAATDAQAAVAEIDSDVTAHVGDAAGAHAATAVSFAPTGTLAATEVQAALAEQNTDITTNLYSYGVMAIPITLANRVGAGDILTTWTPGFAGEFVRLSFIVTTGVTTPAKAADLNLEIGNTNVTGGVVSLTSANCTPLGAVVDGTAISAAYTFTNVSLISVEAASVTDFLEGAGVLLITYRQHLQ